MCNKRSAGGAVVPVAGKINGIVTSADIDCARLKSKVAIYIQRAAQRHNTSSCLVHHQMMETGSAGRQCLRQTTGELMGGGASGIKTARSQKVSAQRKHRSSQPYLAAGYRDIARHGHIVALRVENACIPADRETGDIHRCVDAAVSVCRPAAPVKDHGVGRQWNTAVGQRAAVR
ncbi:MAG: hypothetical protein KCHDKBKB_02018 [Elusimicrobia bacterium]|nr:hypothetical protein [Elusimicrobiota bacterium]